MYYSVVSFNHKKCELSNREKLAFANDDAKREMLNRLASFDFIHEVFIIATCNRIEVVAATRDNFATYHTILGLFSKSSGVNFYELEGSAEQFNDEDAIAHLFSVVSSLDSLVIGESQITGQVKEAFRLSHQNDTAGRKLNRIISYAVKCAAEVRNVTKISENPISIASVAVAQAAAIMGDNLAGMTGVVIGTGDMGTLACKHLLRAGCDVVLIGRDREKTEQIAQELGENVKAEGIEKLSKYINRYRLLFTATSSPEPIVTKDIIETRDMQRLWFDMAIPRDIEDIDIAKIEIYRIDDLKHISQDNHALRQEQALKASEIVDRYKDEFFAWLRALSVEPIIKDMRLQVDSVIDIEMQRAIKKGFIPQENEENIRKMALQMFNKFLHKPTVMMRQNSSEKEGAVGIEALQKIFDIDTENINFQLHKQDHHKGYRK